jgi:predicted TIM-barrel fold metal-dependent hydrolase
VFDAAACVRKGHYRPAHQPLESIEAKSAELGIGHLVLVQPSVYGTDNRALLHSLTRDLGRHRGVVVVDQDVSDTELQAMDAMGVRGVRFNLVSPVGNDAQAFLSLAPRLRAIGWHVQWYAATSHLAFIASLHAATRLPCVLDHLAGLHAGVSPNDVAWADLARLADLGAWVKLSGWYRLRAQEPYDILCGNIRRVAELMSDRLVWGSDWPHTAFASEAMPAYEATWEPVVQALGQNRAVKVLNAGEILYR